MFIALVSVPYTLDHELAWDSEIHLIRKRSIKAALESLKKELEKNYKKDEEVKEILVKHEGFKEGEYFQVYLFTVNPTCAVIPIPEKGAFPIDKALRIKL